LSSSQLRGNVSSELDVARFITTRWNIGGLGEWYFGVNLISRDMKVSPDIDLLKVYVNQFRPQENTTTGFELKLLKARKYGKATWRIDLDRFYQGLGQVLTYFEHGLDKAALIVGFHENCNEHPSEAGGADRLLKTHCSFLGSSVLRAFPYLQIYSLRNEELKLLHHSPDWDKARFPHLSDEAKLRRESIFKLQFASRKSTRPDLARTKT